MRRYQITVGDKSYDIEIVSLESTQARVLVDGRPYEVKFQPAAAPQATGPAPKAPVATTALPPRVSPLPQPEPSPPKPVAAPPTGAGAVTAPMPGVILEVLVNVGDRVQVGDTVLKLEAMKMENDVRAALAGLVTEVRVSKGANVSVGEVLLTIGAS